MTRVAAELAVGESSRVVRVTGAGEVSRRLLEMGLTPGVDIRCLGAAPLGDPRRLATRVADQIAFLCLGLVRAARLPRPDLVLALTSPPFAGALAKLLARCRGAGHAWLAHWRPAHSSASPERCCNA